MKNVMIVDDNCLTAEGIEKNIDWSALDATVIAVEYNILSALDILKDTHVDLIISDIEMPDLDGISMSQKALEIQPFIKVILVSAYDKFEYAKRAIRLCVYDYIEKPLDYHYLTEKIKNAFTDIDRTQKNTELVKASRPVMTEKFFHDLLHYPGVDPATHLSQYLKYLDLRSDYDFFDVLILETEPDPAKSELDFTQYQIQLLNILNLVKEEMEIFDNVFYLKEFSGIVCIIGQNSKHPQHFLQVIHQVASTIVESCKNNVLSLNIGIGSLADSIWKLPVSFASASHSLKYLFFFPHKNIFDARTISEEVGEKKPSQAMFETAMKLLHLTDEDKKRIIMVGNNLERDIVGANRFGITSVFIKWSPRYPMEPKNEEEVPDYIIRKPLELLDLVEKLEAELEKTEGTHGEEAVSIRKCI